VAYVVVHQANAKKIHKGKETRHVQEALRVFAIGRKGSFETNVVDQIWAQVRLIHSSAAATTVNIDVAVWTCHRRRNYGICIIIERKVIHRNALINLRRSSRIGFALAAAAKDQDDYE